SPMRYEEASLERNPVREDGWPKARETGAFSTRSRPQPDGNRHAVQNLLYALHRRDAAHPLFGTHDDTVRQHRDGQRLDIIRLDEVAPRQRRPRLTRIEQVQGAARAGPKRDG